MRSFLTYGAVFVLCFFFGMHGASWTKRLWQHAFPDSPIVQGNFATHYQATGAQVVLYGTKACPYCVQAREFLRLRGIEFADARVDIDAEARARLQSLDLESVPVLLIGDQLIRGFNASAIDASLSRAGLRPVRH